MATGDQPFSAPDSSHVGLWEWHVPSGSFTCNERWAQAVGTTVDALAPRFETRLERIHPDDRERSNRLIEQHFERKLPVYECELRMQHSDGRWVWLLERGSVNEWDHDGNPVRMTGTQLDISERKRMEEALRESQQALRTIFDNTHDAIFVHAVDGRIVDVNRKMLEMYGVTRQQALSASIARDFSTPDNPLDDLGGIWRRVLAGEAITFEWKAKRPNDGSGFDVEVALKRIVLNNDTVVVANVRDITARKANERVLSESEKSFRALVEHSLDGITRWDRAHRHVYVNPIVEQEYGIPAELVIGKTARELGFPRGLCDLWKHAIDEVFASGRVSRIQYEAPSGAWIDWMLMPEVDSAGQVETVITSARDITESKRAEAEKSKLEAQLRQSQKLEAVGRLAGGVAHDFNNMLSVILGTSELALLSLPREAASRKHFENIRAAAERSASLTQQLLAFARKQTISPRVLNLNEAIEGMLKMLRRLIGENIELVWAPAAELWPVRADPSQLHQVLANLCVNARDAIEGVGTIAIDTRNVHIDESQAAGYTEGAAGDFVRLTVRDDGCGMDSATLENVFEPFFTTKEVGRGTGLGLPMVYGVVKQSQGFINVRSERDQGSTFEVYLPRHAVAHTDARATDDQGPALGRETVLLVEDQAELLEIASKMLDRLGYTVLATSSPAEALKLVESHDGPIDLLVTDVIMPQMNGRDLARRLLERFPGLKQLYMSGYPAEVIAHHGVLDEGIHFLAKPFTVAELATKVRAVLDGL